MFGLAEGLQTSKERHCCMKSLHLDLNTKYDILNLRNGFFSNATTCPLWTSWSPLLVVAEV
jgi:hypothetical protein